MHWNRISCRVSIQTGLLLLVCSSAQSGGNIPIMWKATATQIAITYRPTTSGSCTITATDNHNGPVVADLDASKFTGASIDLSRTVANGFRWPTLTNDAGRTVFIGGHDEVRLALDGKWYSTALQVASEHTITVACNDGADTGIIHAQTSNLPVGSNYPELPIPQPTNPNPYPAPTNDCGRTTKGCTDPITGVLLTQVSSQLDMPVQPQPGRAVFSLAYDRTGTAWTNPNNALTNRASGTLAVTSTANAPLFLASDSTWTASTDEQVVLYAKGDGGTETAEACWTEDSGQTCASGAFNTATSEGMAIQTSVSVCGSCSLPSRFPIPHFQSWGNWKTGTGDYDLRNQRFTGINITGSVITMPSLVLPGFNTDRAPGSLIYLTSCSTGSLTNPLTVAHVDSATQITVNQSFTATGCTYQEYSSGIRVILKNSGKLSLSATYQVEQTFGSSGGTNPARDVCNPAPLTDIARDCDGVLQQPNLTGRLCQMQNGGGSGIYLVQDNGRMCLQSIGKHGTIQHLGTLNSPWAGAKTWVGSDNISNLYTVTKTTTDYREYVPGNGNSVPDDDWTYTPVSVNGLTSKIIAAGGPAGAALSTGLFGHPDLSHASLVGGKIELAYQPGGDASPAIRGITDGSFNLLQSYTSWTTYPLRWGGGHSSAGFGFGSFTNLVGNPLASFTTSKLLGGPFMLPITAVRKNGIFQSYILPPTAGTAGNPTRLSIPLHDLAQRVGMGQSGGPYLTCSGGTGAWATVNGTFHAGVPDNNSVTLPVTTSGAMAGSITCQVAPPVVTMGIGAVSDNLVTINWNDGWYFNFVPDNKSLFLDGDPIGISSHLTRQYYVKATGAPSNKQFYLYNDAALTSPTTDKFNVGDTIGLQETCPATSAAALMPNGVLYFDSGSLSGSTPLVRCLTMRVRSQPCSEWASPGEQAKYPCPSDASNTSKSSLQNIQPGDVLYDLAGSDQGNHEHMLVLAVVVNSPTSIDITVMREYGNSPSWQAEANVGSSYCCAHSPGWTPYAYITMQSAWFDSNSTPANNPPPQPESPLYPGIHHDLGPGGGPGLVNLAAGLTGFDDISGVPFAQFLTTPVRTTHNNLSTFARNVNDTAQSLQKQSYPGHRQRIAGIEQNWKTDVTSINPDFGFDSNTANGLISRKVTKIAGFNYVYRISNPAPSGTTNVKLVPYLITAGVLQFADISGPTNCANSPGGTHCITDSTFDKYCIARAANECVAGSSGGQVFYTSKNSYNPGVCISNNSFLYTPCLYPMWPNAGWFEQIRQTPIDRDGSGVRRLTMGWSLPLNHYSFMNWIVSPDAKWGFFVPNPVNGKSGAQDAWRITIPPWPDPAHGGDAVNRTTFVQEPIRVHTNARTSIRIAFGYAENGDPANLYCTTRQEKCWISARVTESNPFAFASEAQERVPCDSECTVYIPAIAGRILFYQIEHVTGSKTVTDPLQAIVVLGGPQ